MIVFFYVSFKGLDDLKIGGMYESIHFEALSKDPIIFPSEPNCAIGESYPTNPNLLWSICEGTSLSEFSSTSIGVHDVVLALI